MHSPLISVYLPTHNRVDRLKRAVESVINQTYKNWQLIIVDDGSEDKTSEYLKQLKSTEARVVVLTHAHPLGACKARNSAIDVALGEFITGLDDDDAFTADRLSYFIKNWTEGYSSLCTPVTICKNGRKVEHNYFVGELTLDDLLVINKIGNQLFCKTNDLKLIGGFDPDFKAWQDYDTWIRFFKVHSKGLKLSRSTYLQYEEESEMSITRSPNRLVGFKQFYNKHCSLMSIKQKNAMLCWESIISGHWVSLFLLMKSDKNIYKYSLLHNLKKMLGR